MDDFIERKKAIDLLEKTNGLVKGIKLGAGKSILLEYTQQLRDGYVDIIRKMPAAQAKAIVIAEWVDVGKTSKGTPIRECSNCHTTKAGRPKSSYCPDCGAKMYAYLDFDQLRMMEV